MITAVYLGVANAVLHIIQANWTQEQLRRLLVVDESLRDDVGVEDVVPMKHQEEEENEKKWIGREWTVKWWK